MVVLIDRAVFAWQQPSERLAFGLEDRDGDLIKSPDEQMAIRRIVELRASGVSLREICSTLESEGHRTKRGGKSWQSMAVKRVLDRLGGAA